MSSTTEHDRAIVIGASMAGLVTARVLRFWLRPTTSDALLDRPIRAMPSLDAAE